MSETTANLALPLIAAAQAQKHVTHNEALIGLDTLVQLACLDKDRTTPPADPAEGDRYLLAAADPTGAWAGLSGRIVRYQDGRWLAFAPKAGWLAWVVDEADLYAYSGTAWIGFRGTIAALQGLARLGIGTRADAANPFAAKLNTALWTALTVAEGGSGDLRCTLNKEAAGNVLSLLFQNGFSGRAEIGLIGDEDLTVRVSGDGATFREALRLSRSTGAVAVVAGTAAAPALAPAGDSDTGTFSPGANLWGVATGGAERLRVDANGNVGFGTQTPRTRLDTALGTLSGAANDYVKAQAAMTGGGTVTWGGSPSRLKWSGRFIAIPMPRATAWEGYVAMNQPTADLPAGSVYDGNARAADATGIVLNSWEALWAIHTPGGNSTALTYAITHYAYPFSAPSNWLLIAAVNGEDGCVRLGNGVILQPGGTSVPGVGRFDTLATTGAATFGGTVAHARDNAFSFGTAGARASVVYAATGTINTSDARDKTPVAPLTAPEIAAATALAREIGTFRFSDAVAAKGDGARLHVGMTVQRAIAIMTGHGLDPCAYGLVCHDAWEAVPARPAVPASADTDAVLDADGTVVTPGTLGAPAIPASPGREAGDRYGFRTDELLMFLARGLDARLSALERPVA